MPFGFRSRRSITTPATAPGDRIYAIGDVHGCHDLFRELLDRIGEHSATRPAGAKVHVIQLGDLVDRGPDSAQVLRFTYTQQQRTERFIVLQGNHELLMLQALEDEPEVLRPWLRIGGRETLRSFGVEPPQRGGDYEHDDALIADMRRAVPAEWLGWMRQLPLTAQSGDYFFCHAGIRPGVPLKRQTADDLLWIRDQFLEDPAVHPAIIVHGHTPTPEVEFRPNRIGIDTGAYKTGVLTALYLEGTERDVIQVRRPMA